ncbi:B-cell receptor CD22 [Hippopotamus amphibius kiboko]|uniref:B-cell receptor CD22 n=1 Tax=Hippopotamus amphibius kiboko TaxID=575201 RepID=UPI00259441C3|nr:B-cell receptor CD22 [Hippopotamus amphibius kiboko]
MHLLGPLLLLLEYLAFSDSTPWRFTHPKTLYAWDGACVWIPCQYNVLKSGRSIDNLTVYHNYKYNNSTKNYEGTILYTSLRTGDFTPHLERVRFLGNYRNNCSLVINPVSVNDSGQLGLRMMSEKDKWMEPIGLNISETAPPPHIELPPEIQEFQKVSVTCLLNFACFEYQIHLQWSLKEPGVSEHTSSSLSHNAKTISTQSTLTFHPQWTHHGKNLTCQLWGPKEERVLSETTVRLDVKHAPKLQIQVSPRDATVTEGESVSLTCVVISSNPPHQRVSWLRDGVPLDWEETLTLTLPEVTRKMSGRYQCKAHNDVGTEESEAVDLQVHYLPEPSMVQISHSPVKEGDEIELTCISPANPPPTNHTWYYNGLEMPGKTDRTLRIPVVVLKHAGLYSCLAENSLGPGQVGHEADLDVQYPPREVTTVIQNRTPIREGDSVTLSCTYNSSNPPVTRYEWRVQGLWDPLVPAGLRIRKVVWDSGPVRCAACNEWCLWSPPVDLDVQYAPRDVSIQVSPDTEIHSGTSVLLQCDFLSSRPTDVRFFWKKNGILLKEGKTLSFDTVSPEDAGTYHCLANNSIGQNLSKPRVLRVLYAPRRLSVSISPKDGVVEGKKAVLTCESDANPPTSHYTWFDWNNQDLRHYDQTLRLDPVTLQHSGAYWCQGTNRLGQSKSPPTTLTVYYSSTTISRRVALGVGFCLAIFLLAIWGVKLKQSWKRIRRQQGPQENSSGQSFFVRNAKARRTPQAEGPHSLGCYNPAMEDAVSYAALRFPLGEMNAPRFGDAGASEMQGLSPNSDDMVTYSVVQKHQVGDYENVTPEVLEDEGIHYSELVHFGAGERPRAQEAVEYVTLKH